MTKVRCYIPRPPTPRDRSRSTLGALMSDEEFVEDEPELDDDLEEEDELEDDVALDEEGDDIALLDEEIDDANPEVPVPVVTDETASRRP